MRSVEESNNKLTSRNLLSASRIVGLSECSSSPLWISKLRIILWIGGILLLGWPGRVWADPAWVDTLSADGRRAVKVTKAVLVSPFHAQTSDWLVAGGVAAGVLLSATIETDVRDEVRSWDQAWLGTVDDVGHTFQNSALYFATAGAFYVGGYAAKRSALRRIGPELVVSYAVAQAGTQLIKHTMGRARPYLNRGHADFHGPTTNDDRLSFWSGDVTTAFVLASVLSAEARRPVVTVLLYGLAATTAFQRMHLDRHWLSDVLAAAAWSTAVGVNVVKIEKRRLKNENGHRLSFHLLPTGITAEW